MALFSFSPAFSQIEDRINSGWWGAVKHVAVDEPNQKAAIVGESYVHLFDLITNRQFHIIKSIENPLKVEFTSAGDLIVLSHQKISLVPIKSLAVLPAKTLYDNQALKDRNYDKLTSTISGSAAYEHDLKDIHYDKLTRVLYASDRQDHIYLFKQQTSSYFKLYHSFELESTITRIATSAHLLALGTINGEILLYNKEKLTPVTTLTGHHTAIQSLHFAPQKQILVSSAVRDHIAGFYGEAICWNLDTKQIQFCTQETHKQVLSSYITANDQLLISSLKEIVKYDLNGNLLGSLYTNYFSDPVFTLYKNKFLYACADEGFTSENIYLADIKSMKMEKVMSFDSRQIWGLNFTKNNMLAITKDNQAVAIQNKKQEVVSLPVFAHGNDIIFKNNVFVGIKLGEEKLKDSLLVGDLVAGYTTTIPLTNEIIERRFSSDFIKLADTIYALTNRNLFNLTAAQSIIRFDVATQTDSSLFGMINKDDFFNVYSPERKFIAGSNYFYEYEARNLIINIRAIPNGTYKIQLKGYKIVKHANQNQLMLYQVQQKQVYSLDMKSMQLKKLINLSTEPYAIELSPDQRWMGIKYGNYGNDIELYDLNTNKVQKLMLSRKHVDCFTFSPNNKYVLTGNRFGEIEIWDVNTVTRKGVIFTSISHNDYVMLVDQHYDGTKGGIQYLLQKDTIKAWIRQKKLFAKTFFY